MSTHPLFANALRAFAGVAPDAKFHANTPPAAPVDATRAHIQKLEARVAELERQLRFKQEAIAQFAARYEELCPHDMEAELPDGSVVTAPEQVVHDTMIWLRDKYCLEFGARIDDQTLLHFEVEKAEARLERAMNAREDRQS